MILYDFESILFIGFYMINTHFVFISAADMVMFFINGSQIVLLILGTPTNTSALLQPAIWMNASVFLCRNQEVISLLGRCDNRYDCFDSSDEDDCPDTTGSNILTSLMQFKHFVYHLVRTRGWATKTNEIHF